MPVKQWLLAIHFASTENPTLTHKQVEEAVGQSEKPTNLIYSWLSVITRQVILNKIVNRT